MDPGFRLGSVRGGGDSMRAGSIRAGSMRRTVSSWRASSSASSVFGRSAREEDDEEALKWAAIEKLPTYDRLRKGILAGAAGGTMDRKNLLERLVRTAEEDNERFLLKLRNRMERVGIDNPTIEVRFENLNIDAEAYVGNRGIPTFVNVFVNKFTGFLSSLHILPSGKRPISILHDVSGIIKPCRMTLLLGPPGSGKTTLLLALAGKLDSALKVEGRVSYNGHNMNEFVPRRTSAYIGQNDLHIRGEMTVRETLAFSARCQGVGTRYDMLTELSRREKEANIKPDPDIDVYMKTQGVFIAGHGLYIRRGVSRDISLLTGRVTTKADVFSFEVILMELITGKKALDNSRDDESAHLVTWFKRMQIKNEFPKVVDPAIDLTDAEISESVNIVSDLAGHCSVRDPHQRPDMSHVVNILSSFAEKWKPSRHNLDDVLGMSNANEGWQRLLNIPTDNSISVQFGNSMINTDGSIPPFGANMNNTRWDAPPNQEAVDGS